MMLNDEQYRKIEDIVFDAAQGSGLSVVSEIQTEDFIDANGHKRHMQRTKQESVNIPLALKLLEQRIGGPQDWC